MKNKTVILVTMLPLWSMNNGCGGKALFNTVDMLSNSGCDLYYITNQKNDYSHVNIKEENIIYIDTEWYFNLMTKNKVNKYNTLKYYIDFKKKIVDSLEKVIKKCIDSDILIYAYEVQTVLGCRKVASKYNIPLLTRFQGTIMSQYKDSFLYKILKYPHLQALSTKADLIIMTDDGTQGDKVLKRCKNDSKLLFIRNGVNILDEPIEHPDIKNLRKELNIPNDKTVLLVCSRLESWKKVDRSIEALSRLNLSEYYLVVVGDGAEKKHLIQMAKDLNVYSNICFTGAVENKEVKKYMQAADIFLSFYDLSNVGNPLLEALCLGKPIITYNVGDTNRIIDGKNGIILDDVSPTNIAINIEKINNSQDLKKLSQNAIKYAEKNLYSWNKRMDIEKQQIEKLLNGGKNDKKR